MLTDNLGVFLVAAIEVAGPVLACLFLSELTLGLLARAAPSLNVFNLAFPLRIVVALLLVAVALPLDRARARQPACTRRRSVRGVRA